ncbi:MAPEG family protein [Methyloligella halotolerans]|uniref:MAPEG family protein n=1 Tax=Methyloligella halotolerans TaxID=1177755 RepID=A0A1E2RW89_9HYPH|nr:MAPEG family protein [Methyloligella halotolerans]ODA66526.1 MAPEG family protein [Methyloligella halotolerans]
MSIQSILLPMFVQVLLTFILLFWMIGLRLQALRRGQVRAEAIALRESKWPPRVIQIGNAFHNQLEVPVLFYVVMLLALTTQTLDLFVLVLAWMFVISRIVHAVIHVTSNSLQHRTPVFLIGAIAVLLIWIIVIGRLIVFTSL